MVTSIAVLSKLVSAPLLAPSLDAFLNVGDHAVCHGGIALEEVIVPFIQISRK